MKSKREIKSLMGWHKQNAPDTKGCYYTTNPDEQSSPRMTSGAEGINIYRLAADDPNDKKNDIVGSLSFPRCDHNWVKDKVRNLALEKQKIHTRRKCAVVPGFPAEEELLDDIKGYNGKWKQTKAGSAWPEHLERKENEKQRQEAEKEKREALRLKQQRAVSEHYLKIRQRRVMEEERKRLAEIKRAKQQAMLEEELQKKRADEDERNRKLNEKKPCGTCEGSGTCVQCHGKGYHVFMYLSSQVTATSNEFRGRMAKGCEHCGGLSEYTASGKLKKGNGKCSECDGTGKVDVDREEQLERGKNGSFLNKHGMMTFRTTGMGDVNKRASSYKRSKSPVD